MSSELDPVQELAELLREAGVSPRVRPERVVRSTLYDLDYHVALIACVFFITTAAPHRVVAHWLKILQFIAVRPTLLPSFQIWAAKRRRQDLDTWQKMPRGYVGDRTHDRTVELLVATGVLVREGEELVEGTSFVNLRGIYENLVAKKLLCSERATLLDLSKTRVNKTLLKGV